MDPELNTSCCSPARPEANGAQGPATTASGAAFYPQQTAEIAGGKAIIGTDNPAIADDGESPLRRRHTKPFHIMRAAVTNETFGEFIKDTGYITEAELIGWSFVFHSDVPADHLDAQAVVGAEWWRKVEGATWQAPHGPGQGRPQSDHPVVQVSWNDAVAFARWCGGRLPSEQEWEHAARGGLADVPFPWGSEEPSDTASHLCNIWQGRFPDLNTAKDGWTHTAPSESFLPNGYGLYNMVGNVWEWTGDPYRIKSLKRAVTQKMAAMRGFKLLKGGSYLCHRSYCYRYRIAARSGNSPDSATPHQGFRVVWDMI